MSGGNKDSYSPVTGQRLITSRNAILLQMHSHLNTVKFVTKNKFFLQVSNTIKILEFPCSLGCNAIIGSR